jgi:hypothetical protein
LNKVKWGTELIRLANRVATNRIVAGLRFPVDAAAGMVLGLTLGQYFVNWSSLDPNAANPNGAYVAWEFDGTQFTNMGGLDGDFHCDTLYNPTAPAQLQTAYAAPILAANGNPAEQPLTASPILNWLWNQAITEWQQ